VKERETHRADVRRDTIKSHLLDEEQHDPYKSRGKLAEPTVCPQCGAAFKQGRWQWVDQRAEDAERPICPACMRVNDKYPAGELTLRGAFALRHAEEIKGLVRNVEEAEKSQHPLQRLIAVEDGKDSIVITTTGIHLPRRLGHAIEHAYKGQLETHYGEPGHFVRMVWTREV
jgi:NMD protein affecting ribosome stability and mRNA decay